MNGKRKRVFRVMLAWNDRKEERWLTEQAKAGWHVERMGLIGYTLVQGPPADMAYRLDVGPAHGDRTEYLGLFRDAGWEHVGRRGIWHLFRKPVLGREVPEIHTDPQSRISMYRRLLGVSTLMMLAMVLQIPGGLSRADGSTARWMMLWLQILLAGTFAYGSVRMLLAVNRLRKHGI